MSMRYPVVCLLLLLALGPSAVRAAQPAPASMPMLIPLPRSMETCPGGVTLGPRDAVVIDARPADARLLEVADFLRDAIAGQTGVQLQRVAGRVRGPRIELRRDPRIEGDEAYRLDIGGNGAVIRASGDRGLLWGAQSLRQLLPAERVDAIRLPCLRIEDAPALGYRGQMLDVARHFHPVDFIKRQLDVLSYYKINTFRWHLTDDQGWRIEIKRYPRLTSVGGWRIEADGSRHGGFYTQDEVREVVEYARRRGIMVIPEIEMPGHATAALVAYPEYACAPPPSAVPTTWGVLLDIYCPGKEETFGFLEGVLDEVIALFPAPYLHIGGDEVPKDRWRACDSCQALMRREGLRDEGELQAWFVRRIQAYLRGKGRTLIGWDEILEGGADRSAIVEVWRGEAEGRKALANGNRIINASPYYLDTPPDRLTLAEIYRRDPLADPEYRARGAQVWGAEAPLWSERVTPLNAEAMLYPRMLAFAEITWNADARDFAGFRRRLPAHYAWLGAHGIAFGAEDRPVAAYGLSFDRGRRQWRLSVQHGFADMRSHYAIDDNAGEGNVAAGKAPYTGDPGFGSETMIDRPGVLRVAPFRDGRQRSGPVRYRLVSHLALGAPARFAASPKRPHADALDVLSDGILGGDEFGDGTWAGWQGPDLDVTLDLGERRRFRRIAVNFLQQAGSWIVFPREVSYAISDDGKRWRTLHAQPGGADGLATLRETKTIAWTSPRPVAARWVRVLARTSGVLPEGHAGAGQPAWIFADEVVVE